MTLKIWTGPCWVDQYKEQFEFIFRNVNEVTITTGTEHVYINNVSQRDLDAVIMNISRSREMLEHATKI